uniref:Uncharacterized protein n=1 Tax=Oryza barthii TaxID=65489 RepID=A0A0D3EPB6_9ORYZ
MVARLPSSCASSDTPWLPSQPSFLASSTLVEPSSQPCGVKMHKYATMCMLQKHVGSADPTVLTWLHHYSSTSAVSFLYPLSGEPALEVDPRWPGGGKGGIDQRGEAARTSRGGENQHAE